MADSILLEDDFPLETTIKERSRSTAFNRYLFKCGVLVNSNTSFDEIWKKEATQRQTLGLILLEDLATNTPADRPSMTDTQTFFTFPQHKKDQHSIELQIDDPDFENFSVIGGNCAVLTETENTITMTVYQGKNFVTLQRDPKGYFVETNIIAPDGNPSSESASYRLDGKVLTNIQNARFLKNELPTKKADFLLHPDVRESSSYIYNRTCYLMSQDITGYQIYQPEE